MSDVKERLRGPYDYTADGQSLFVPERDIEDAIAEIARLEARVAEQDARIAALTANVEAAMHKAMEQYFEGLHASGG